MSRNLYTDVFRTFASALQQHFPHMSVAQIITRIVFATGSTIYYHGLGKIAMELSSGSCDAEIDREAMLKDIIDFTMNGFGGNPQ